MTRKTNSAAAQRLAIFLLAAAAILPPATAHAQSPLDGFNAGYGASEAVHAVAVQPDGKILIGGQFTVVDGRARTGVARLHANGALDEGFVADTNATVFSLHAQAGGKILVGGGFTEIAGQPRTGLARLNPDGTVDPSFDPQVEGTVFAIAEQPDGKLVIGGFFPRVGGQARNSIARLHADGTLDTTFSPGWGADHYVLTLALQLDGKILIGGHFQWVDGQARRHLARLHPNGALDTGFQLNTDGPVRALVVQPDGNILAGGSFTTIGQAWRIGLARFDPYGAVDGGLLSIPGAPDVHAVALQADGGILIAGDFPYYNGVDRSRIARVNAGGTLDGTFDPGADALVRKLVVQPDGRILLGGNFTTAAGQPSRHVARITAGGRFDLHGFNPGAEAWSDPVLSIAVQPDGKILAGGRFGIIAGEARSNLARLNGDGTLDAAFDPQVDDDVFAVAVQPDGKILIGGWFDTVNGQPYPGCARLNPDGSLDLTFKFNMKAFVQGMVLQPDGKILISGQLLVPGLSRPFIARIKSDGSPDATFIQTEIYAASMALQPDGKVLIAGPFQEFAGHRRVGIARLKADGGIDTELDARLDNLVSAMALQPDGKIVISGRFHIGAGGDWSRDNFARLNPDGTLDESFVPQYVYPADTMALQADGKILLGGFYFWPGLARFNPDGSWDDTFKIKVTGEQHKVSAITLQPDGKVLIGGDFTHVDGVPRLNLARITNNDPATQDLLVDPSGTTVTWRRNGASPELGRAVFETSTDGVYYRRLGEASPVSGGWKLGGLALPAGKVLWIRARGLSQGGSPASGSLVETVRSFLLP